MWLHIFDNKLATSVHYKPTDSHSYLLYSSSHPSHVKDSIPYSQFLRLRRLCSEDSDFNSKCDEMSNFFSERGYPDSILSKALNRVQNVNRESALEPEIQTLTPNATKCPISFPNVAILTASCLKHSIVSKTSIENRL